MVFSKKWPWLSALGFYVITWLILKTELFGLSHNLFMYRIHLVAFPIGMLFASIVAGGGNFFAKFKAWVSQGELKVVAKGFSEKVISILKNIVSFLLFVASILLFLYFFSHSGVGRGITVEQTLSILTAISVLIVFLLKKFEIKLLYIFGVYSYEIYLLHWPIMYSYDIFYRFLPAWLATVLYLVFFVGLGLGLQRLSKVIVAKIL